MLLLRYKVSKFICLSNCLSLEGNDTDIKPQATVMILNDHRKSTDNLNYCLCANRF